MHFTPPTSPRSHSSTRVRFRRFIQRSLTIEALDKRLLMAADLQQAMESDASDVAALVGQTSLRTRVSRELLDLHALSTNPNTPILTSTMQNFLMVEDGKVQVHVAGSDVGQVQASLARIGFETLYLNPTHNSLDGYLPIAAIPQIEEAISQFSVGVVPNFRPMTGVGSVTSEADVALQTRRVRETQPLGYDGSGTRIGVLSDSFNNLGGLLTDVASGDLPVGGVTVLQDLSSGGIDEGRAMLQLVHDLAPGAELGFATAFVGGQAGFAANISALANTFNADVVVDDVFYFAEPLFQDGLIAQAITNVTNSGTAYVSLAGNLSDQAYEAQGPFATSIESFTISGFGSVSVNALDMDPGAATDFRQSITIANGQQVILTFQWDDPFFATVDTDIDVFLVDTTNNQAVAFGVTDNFFTQEPVEVIGFTNDTGANRTYEIVLDLFGGPIPGRIKWVNYGANNSGDITIEHDTLSPTVIPHSTAPGALSVGAVPYFDQDTPESFTSIGPATILFTSTGLPITPEVRAKPDLVAIDGTNNTFFGVDVEGDGRPNFFGTSAAAPHAAAVAALIKQANPSFTPAQIFAAMTSTAEDIGPVGFDTITGAGLVDAFAALYGEGVPASLPLVEDFEKGVLGQAWEVDSSGNGRIQVITGSGPAAGYHHLAMDTFIGGGPFGLNEAILHFDATGAEDVVLTFQHAEFGDEDHPMPATFSGSINADGVAMSVDGQNWFRLISLTGSDSSAVYRARKFNLTDVAAANSLTLGANVMIKFQQFDNFPINSDGIVFDNITLRDNSIVAAGWQPLGPFSATRGQTENVAPNNNVSGAMHTVIAHPTDPNILYAGGTNGGVWKTTNATAGMPNWVPLTDSMPSQSIGALTFDRANPENVYAGVGLYSSYGRIGNNRIGLLKSTDAGANFSVVNGGGLLTGKNISGLHVNGNTIVLSVNFADSFTYGNIGIFRSTNGGTSFDQISNGNGSATGLPGGSSYDLVADPLDPNILYTSVIFADGVGGVNGVYKSTNQGATWTRVSTPAMQALMSNNTSNLELAVGTSNNIYAAIINIGSLAGLFRSGDGGATWVQMDTPTTNENGTDVGLNPGGGKGPGPGSAPSEIAGGQGVIHFAIVADPTDANIVYVGGDRQPLEFQNPTSIGAVDFSGRLFRGNAAAAPGSQWQHLTHSNSLGAPGGGTASSSSPHADSREMVFDANGDLIEVDDGGIYRRTDPRSNQGDWFSLNGNLQVTEAHDVAWDSVSKVAITGNQDTGTTYQPYEGAEMWVSLSTADGGDVIVDDVSLAGSGQSIRYSSFQNLGGFRRTVWDANGNLLSTAFPARTVIDGAAFAPSFVTKMALNAVDPTRLAIQGNNSVYESLTQGNTMSEVGVGFGSGDITQNALAYGGRKNGVDNANVLWAATGSNVAFRSGPGAMALVPADPTIETIRDLAIDPDDWSSAFIVDRDQVFATSNEGNSWADITGDLLSFASDLRSIVFLPGVSDFLIVGTNQGVFATALNALGTWLPLAPNFPNVLVYELEYDATDDVLVAATLGRGAWLLEEVSAVAEALLDAVPPTINSVFAYSTEWGAPFIDSVDGGGTGSGNGVGFALTAGGATLPWNDVNRLKIQFSENVLGVSGSTIELRDSTGPLPITVSYDVATFVATIEVNSSLTFKKLRLAINDAVTDAAGNPLDGDQVGGEGGLFNLRFDVVAGDSNADGRVNGSDLGAFSAAFNAQVGQANFNPRANWNGDARVNGADLAVFSANFNFNVASLGEPSAPFGGSGQMAGGFSAWPLNDLFFASLANEEEEEEEQESQARSFGANRLPTVSA